MKQLLRACQQALRSGLAYIRPTDIYITEDVRLIRRAGSYPAIGLKDGGIKYGEETSAQDDQTYGLTAAVYVLLTRQEAALMGAVDQKGALDVAAEATAILRPATFGRFDVVRVLSQGESEILVSDGQAILLLLVRLEYDIYDQ